MNEIDEIAQRIHTIAAEHGFWDKPRNLGEMLMLATSELAEALECDRDNEPKVWFRHADACPHYPLNELHDLMPARDGCLCTIGPKPEGTMVEVVDAIIRLFDTGQDMASKVGYQWTISRVMKVKMDYNARRKPMHGKAY